MSTDMKAAQLPARYAPVAVRSSDAEVKPALTKGLPLVAQRRNGAQLGHHLDALPIGAPDDRYEQEADRAAEQVVEQLQNGPGPSTPIEATPTPGPAVQAKGEGGAASGSAAALTRLPPAPGSGRPLEPAVRTSMEQAFGANLGGVRLHTGEPAQRLNQSLNARATTVGRHIHFDKGQYDPDSTSGRELLAHELTHVLQQRQGGVRAQRWPWSKKGKKKGDDSIPLLEMGAGRSDEGESEQSESGPDDFDLASPSSSSAAAGSGADEALMESSDFDPASPSSSSAAAGSEAGEALKAPSEKVMKMKAKALDLKDKASDMIALHQNYTRHRENLQGGIGRALEKILNVCDRILSIVEKVDASGVTAVVRASISLLRTLGGYIYEAHSILSNSKLKQELQPLLKSKVDIGALIKESLDFGKAIKAVVDTATKVA